MSESLRQACEWLEAWHTQYLGGPEEEVASLAALIEAARAEELAWCADYVENRAEHLTTRQARDKYGDDFAANELHGVSAGIRARGDSPTEPAVWVWNEDGTRASATGGNKPPRMPRLSVREHRLGRSESATLESTAAPCTCSACRFRAELEAGHPAMCCGQCIRKIAAAESALTDCREVYERALAAERETIASVRAALAQAVEELEAWRRCHDAANRGDTAAEDRELTEALRLRATSGGERG